MCSVAVFAPLPPVPQGAYLAKTCELFPIGSHEITDSVVKNSNSGVWCLNPTVVLEEGPTSAQWTGGHPFRSRSTDPFSSVEQFNLTTGPALQTIGNHSLCFYGEINNGSHRLFHSVTVSLEAQN